MTIHLRPVETCNDIQRIAELLYLASPQRINRERFSVWLSRPTAERLRWQIVAVDRGGHIVGYGAVGHEPGMATGCFWLDYVVEAAALGSDVEEMLRDDLTQFAWEQGATSFEVASWERLIAPTQVCQRELVGSRR